MKFELNEYHRCLTDDELIADLKNVAKMLNKDTVTEEDYNQYGKYHATTLTRRFGSWFICLEKAGLDFSRSKIGITNEELFAEIERVWIQLGKQPTYTKMNDISKFSAGTYERRFGGWRKALQAFVDYVNGSTESMLYNEEIIMENDGITHRTSRTINLRIRFLVLQRDNFKCCACGASPAKDPSVELHVDHIIPWSKGGETVIDNLQTLCSKCNIGKSDVL